MCVCVCVYGRYERRPSRIKAQSPATGARYKPRSKCRAQSKPTKFTGVALRGGIEIGHDEKEKMRLEKQ